MRSMTAVLDNGERVTIVPAMEARKEPPAIIRRGADDSVEIGYVATDGRAVFEERRRDADLGFGVIHATLVAPPDGDTPPEEKIRLMMGDDVCSVALAIQRMRDALDVMRFEMESDPGNPELVARHDRAENVLGDYVERIGVDLFEAADLETVRMQAAREISSSIERNGGFARSGDALSAFFDGRTVLGPSEIAIVSHLSVDGASPDAEPGPEV